MNSLIIGVILRKLDLKLRSMPDSKNNFPSKFRFTLDYPDASVTDTIDLEDSFDFLK